MTIQASSVPTRVPPLSRQLIPPITFAADPDFRGAWRLDTAIFLPLTPEALFPFFADARNLEEITPPWLRFALVDAPAGPLASGALINYRLRIRGVPIRWQTRIDDWDPPRRFTDEQKKGPYRRWHHEHRFFSMEGGTLMTDRVSFAAIGGPLVRRFLIEPDLRRIFTYRHERIRARFGGAE